MTAVRHAKPRVLAELPLDRHASIEASAGTGKTFTLEHLVVELLLSTETRIDELLVVTFTERATAELKARIRRTLSRLLQQEQDEGDLRGPCWLLDDAARAKLRAALQGLDGATIATLHGFCQRTLAEQAFDSGRLFEEAQVDAREAFHQAFLELVRRELAPEGKDRQALSVWLARGQSVEALEELLFTCAKERGALVPAFDPAALQRAILSLGAVDGDAIERELQSKALHGNSRPKVLRLLLPLLGAVEGWQGRGDALTLLGEVDALLAQEGARSYLPQTLAKAKGALLPALGQELEALAEAAPSLEAGVVGALLPRMRQALATFKRERGLFDFDDMLTLVRDALRGPRGPALAAALRGRYRYALVDEFQDTDEVQWEIFRTVFHGPSCPPVLYLIGDPKQAIYGFRGADVHTYLAARQAILDGGGTAVSLEENFRSTPALLQAVNRILEQSATPPFFRGPVTYPAPVRCGKPALRLRHPDGGEATPVEVWQLVGVGKLTARGALEGLAAAIAADVARLADPAQPGLLLDGRRLGPGDVFVLTRTEKEGRTVGAALRAAGVPVAFYKQEGLLQSAEAHAVRDLLQAIARPDDLAALRKAWLTPFFGLTVEALSGLGEVPAAHPLRALVQGWKGLADGRDYERLFPRILEESGLVRRALFAGNAERALTNVQHLFELLLAEVHRTRGSIDELVRALSAFIRGQRTPPGADPNLQRLETDAGAVQVMTLHKSKGLEAPLCYLVGGLTRSPARELSVFHEGHERKAFLGTVPPGSALAQQIRDEEEAEQQRLLYVGLTRAAGRVVLPYLGPLDDAATAQFTMREGAAPAVRLHQPLGAYAALNARLQALHAEGALTAPNGFGLRQVVCGAPPRSLEGQAPAPAPWTPPPELLQPPPPQERVAELRARHAGFFVTSYSRMAASAPGPAGEEDAASSKIEPVEPAAAWVALPEGELAPGAQTGLFLHALLERLPLAATAAAADLAAFCALPEVEALLAEAAALYGIAPRQLEHAARVCFAALRAPLPLPGGAVVPGVARAERVLREVEFLFPIPEAHHPSLAAPGAGRFTIERGCIKGFVDLVLEHRGRVLFADWKSDLLPAYDPATLAARVQERYALQERLYTLALLRLLGIATRADYEARWGGSLYLFVRGMGAGQGLHAARPSWEQVQQWERELCVRDDFGIAI